MSPSVSAFVEEYIDYIRRTFMSGNFGNVMDGWEWNAYERIPEGFLTNNPSEGANNRLAKRAVWGCLVSLNISHPDSN